MKVLLDSCVWGGARFPLIAAGHDVACVADWNKDPGDDEILKHAHKDNRILVTLDKDFGELAVLRNVAHSGILRLVGITAKKQGPICAHVLAVHGVDLEAGAIVTAEAGRLRIRLAETSSQ